MKAGRRAKSGRFGIACAWLVPALVGPLPLALLACNDPPGPPPFGMKTSPSQRFQLEASEGVEVDGSPVEILRFGEFELRTATEASEGGSGQGEVTHIELYLLRYYQSVEGAPGGATEIKIDQNGLASSTEQRGTQRLALDDTLPYSGTVRDLFRHPVSSVGLDDRGRVVVPLWHTEHPILTGVHLLDWWLLAVPPRPDEPALAWSAHRELPQIGQYVLGARLPLRLESPSGIGGRIASSGSLRRDGMRIAEGFSGDLELDQTGDSGFDAAGRLLDAKLQLRMIFRAEDGSVVQSRHQVKITCTSCDGTDAPVDSS